jgi:hypothetical protein
VRGGGSRGILSGHMARQLLVRAANVAMLSAMLVAMALPANAALTYGPVVGASSLYAWTDGGALGRTTGALQLAWASDCPPPRGRCATDMGPHVGVYAQHAPAAATPVWSAPVRVSPRTVHAMRPALGASGTDVYVAWVVQRRWVRYRPSAPRVLWIRSSTNEGTSFGMPTRLSPSAHRVDYPSIAASGHDAWVVWTDAATGTIEVATTADDGAHWSAPQPIGSTSAGTGTSEGRRGDPSVGASGSNVVVAWFADRTGAQQVVTSHDGGSAWSPAATLPGSSRFDDRRYPVVRGADDGLSSRIAVAYSTGTGLAAEVYDGSSLGPPRVVESFPRYVAARRYGGGYGDAVIPFGASGLAAAYTACRSERGLTDPCSPGRPAARLDILERESLDDGATWGARTAVSLVRGSKPINEAPSIEADGTTGWRWFSWLGRTSTWSTYRVLARAGTSP